MPTATEKTAPAKLNLSRLQTQKAQAVRLANKAKRDPILRKHLTDHAAALAAKDKDIEALNAMNLELAETLSAEEARAKAAEKRASEAEAAAKAAEAEAAKLRKELQAALAKSKPAGGQ